MSLAETEPPVGTTPLASPLDPVWPEGHSPHYPNTATWVSEWLCPTMEREITRSVAWCPMWWDHPEAAERLDALWEAWELGRLGGGTWKSAWWVQHADRHLSRLCHPDTGPFGHCHSTHRRDTPAWRSEPIPANDVSEISPQTTSTTQKEHTDG